MPETQTIEFRAASGLTLTAELFAIGSDTIVDTESATEETNRSGTYRAAFTDVAAGEYQLVAFSGTVPVASWLVTLTLNTATFQTYDRATAINMRGTDDALLAASYTAPANSDITAIKTKTDQFVFTVANQVDANALTGGGSGLDAAGVRSAIGLASANLDTQLADLPTVAEFEARTIVAADYFVVGDYTAPANSDITSIKTKTDQFVFTVANQVDANALSGGGSGLDAAGVRSAIGLASANLDTQLGDLPTVAEFEARSLVSADYFVVGDYTAPLDASGVRSAVGLATANLDTQLADLPTNAEFDARSLPSADYFVVSDYTAPPTASANASQVRTELTTELGRIDATISSRSTFAGGAVASVTDPVTVATNNDKTGYALATAPPTASEVATQVRTELSTELARVDVATSTRLATSGYTAPPTASAIADAVLTESVLDHRNVANSLAKFVWQIRQANLTVDGTVSNAITPTTLTFASNVAATTSAYAHAVLLFITGPLIGENSPIISYNNTNGVFVLEEPLTAAPSNGDEFVVIAGSHVHSVADIQSGLALEATLTDIKGAGFATGTDSLKELRDAVDGIDAGAGNTAEEISEYLEREDGLIQSIKNIFVGIDKIVKWLRQ